MPIIIPEKLPAYSSLKEDNVFVITDDRACHQDIRPLEIALVNLMPTKIKTETQLIRLLANKTLQLELTLIHMDSHNSKNTKIEHLKSFYNTFDNISKKKFDGMIITGAPVETLEFEDVDYWDELVKIMKFSLSNVFSTMHLCWGVQAALYYHYNIKRKILDEKISGVFSHHVKNLKSDLMRGFDDVFFAPHSRYTQIPGEDFLKVPDMEILAESDKAGVHIAALKSMRQIFIQGHGEYDKYTLKKEYERDVELNPGTKLPENYFCGHTSKGDVIINWRSHSHLLFSNWINYCVYQRTPYNIKDIGTE